MQASLCMTSAKQGLCMGEQAILSHAPTGLPEGGTHRVFSQTPFATPLKAGSPFGNGLWGNFRVD